MEVESLQCPRCGNQASQLQEVDAAIVAKLREQNPEIDIPSSVCANCFSQLAAPMARGSVLLAREKAKEQKKLMLWKSRVNLIKQARQAMKDKAFSEAAVAYEKYIKVLEIIFDTQTGGLAPEQFKDSARTQELTVVASVYWDLLRIYDTSERYGDRQGLAATKLAQFLRFTPIYPDITRKAEAFARTAKNASVIRSFLKDASEEKGRCFIATAAFDSPFCDEVFTLQNWRDQVLNNSTGGRIFIKFYYAVSPTISNIINRLDFMKPGTRRLLRWFIHLAIRQDFRLPSRR